MSPPERNQAIAARAEEIDIGTPDCLNPCYPDDSSFWEEGAAAFRRDDRMEQCPLEPGPAQDDWLRGWMAAELLEFGKIVGGSDG
jgi:hypothetical protein